MAEWQEQLNTILSDPDAMAQIAALAQSISARPEETQGQPAGRDAPKKDTQNKGTQENGTQKSSRQAVDPDALRSALGGLDPELLRRLMPLVEQLNRPESNETTAFLMALRPFLSEARRGKVERAAQLARLIHLGKTFLTTQGQEASGRV